MIPHPADMTIGQRIMLTLIIVLIILFALAAFGFLAGRWSDEAQGAPELRLYEGMPFDAKLLQLDKEALQESYKDQVKHLFFIWLKGQAGDPQNIINGLKIARRAYSAAAAQIAQRERQLEQQK